MMLRKGKFQALFLIAVYVFLVIFFIDSSFAQQVPPKKQNDSREEKIIPSPKNIKENTSFYVFIGWMWLSIIVLIYFLRLKIKEADRLYKLKFFSKDKK